MIFMALVSDVRGRCVRGWRNGAAGHVVIASLVAAIVLVEACPCRVAETDRQTEREREREREYCVVYSISL